MTRSAYVVQRHFRLVRKGYDPAEVDRHLELVSEWFRAGRTAKKAREVERELQARERAAAETQAQADRLLKNSRLEAEATLEGARLRADADRHAAEHLLQEADVAAEKRLREAEETLTRAREESDGQLRQAHHEAREVLPLAREQSEKLLAQAHRDAEQMREAARAEVATIVDQSRLQAAAADIVREAEDKAQLILAEAERAALSVLPRRVHDDVNRNCTRHEPPPSSSSPPCEQGPRTRSGHTEHRQSRSYKPTSNAATARSTALSKPHDASAAELPARPTAPELRPQRSRSPSAVLSWPAWRRPTNPRRHGVLDRGSSSSRPRGLKPRRGEVAAGRSLGRMPRPSYGSPPVEIACLLPDMLEFSATTPRFGLGVPAARRSALRQLPGLAENCACERGNGCFDLAGGRGPGFKVPSFDGEDNHAPGQSV